jgi:hypothetical protein
MDQPHHFDFEHSLLHPQVVVEKIPWPWPREDSVHSFYHPHLFLFPSQLISPLKVGLNAPHLSLSAIHIQWKMILSISNSLHLMYFEG